MNALHSYLCYNKSLMGKTSLTIIMMLLSFNHFLQERSWYLASAMRKGTCTHDVILWNAVTAAFIIMGHGATLKYETKVSLVNLSTASNRDERLASALSRG